MKLDRTDRRVLQAMQRNARISNLELAEVVGLSPTPCSRRVKRLEGSGIIRAHVTLLNQTMLGLKLTAYIGISMDRHTPDRFETFEQEVAQ
jgi:Lrp/AsnC family leucine-responsive transcriptional regulator